MNGKSTSTPISTPPQKESTLSDDELLLGIAKGWHATSERTRWFAYYVTNRAVLKLRSNLEPRPGR